MSLPTPDALRAAASRLPRLPSAPEGRGPIAVAVSGGADSVYLLCALWADEGVRPRLHVLHFDHRVRGEASAEDARFVAALCAALDLPCVLGMREGQGNASEADLRAARDAFFAEQRQALGFELLCTAHHLDDVVEMMCGAKQFETKSLTLFGEERIAGSTQVSLRGIPLPFPHSEHAR